MSVAGKRAGLRRKQSSLFYHATRIIKEMREKTNGEYPKFIIWENVLGAFSSNKAYDFRAVLEEITETQIPKPKSNKWATACLVRSNGLSVAWRVLDTQYWGVPQRRKRVYLVVSFVDICASQILFKPESVSRYPTREATISLLLHAFAIGFVGKWLSFDANHGIMIFPS